MINMKNLQGDKVVLNKSRILILLLMIKIFYTAAYKMFIQGCNTKWKCYRTRGFVGYGNYNMRYETAICNCDKGKVER